MVHAAPHTPLPLKAIVRHLVQHQHDTPVSHVPGGGLVAEAKCKGPSIAASRRYIDGQHTVYHNGVCRRAVALGEADLLPAPCIQLFQRAGKCM